MLRSNRAEDPVIVSFYIVSYGFEAGRVSNLMFSVANSACLYCTLHFSHMMGGSRVGLLQQTSNSMVVLFCHLLAAPCRTFISLCTNFAELVCENNFKVRFRLARNALLSNSVLKRSFLKNNFAT